LDLAAVDDFLYFFFHALVVAVEGGHIKDQFN
jgi:hypothetical protein